MKTKSNSSRAPKLACRTDRTEGPRTASMMKRLRATEAFLGIHLRDRTRARILSHCDKEQTTPDGLLARWVKTAWAAEWSGTGAAR